PRLARVRVRRRSPASLTDSERLAALLRRAARRVSGERARGAPGDYGSERVEPAALVAPRGVLAVRENERAPGQPAALSSIATRSRTASPIGRFMRFATD